MQRLRKSGILLRNLWLRLVDPKRLSELAGDRVVFKHLKDQGFLDPFRNKRILEIGPKHGQDSMLLTTLDPSELTLIDLPEKEIAMKEWFSQVSWKSRPTLFSGNVLYLTQEQYKRLGMFDLIWCLGVLYHNAEQLRLLRRLFDLLNIGGCVVIESATTRNKKLEKLNVVEIHWPSAYRNVPTITHLPSRLAIKSWLEMVGFNNTRIWEIYSKDLGRQRAVLTGVKTRDSKPYVSYAMSGLNPIYAAGDAA